MSLGIIKVVQMNEASSSGVSIGKVSPERRGEPTSNKTAWVVVGTSASTVEVAEGWELGSGSDGDGVTGSVIIKGTCSLDPGVRVVSIEEDSVGRAGPVVFRFKNFPLESRAGGTVGGVRNHRFFTSSLPSTRAILFRFCWYKAIASGFPRNVGNAIFGLIVVDGSSAESLVWSSFVLFFIAWIRSFTTRFASSYGYESVGYESDSGWGGVNNTGYVLKNGVGKSIDIIWRLLKIYLKLKYDLLELNKHNIYIFQISILTAVG